MGFVLVVPRQTAKDAHHVMAVAITGTAKKGDIDKSKSSQINKFATNFLGIDYVSYLHILGVIHVTVTDGSPATNVKEQGSLNTFYNSKSFFIHMTMITFTKQQIYPTNSY